MAKIKINSSMTKSNVMDNSGCCAEPQSKQSDYGVFFDESGVTSTSANHIANIAKEYYTNIETSHTGMSFFKTEIQLLNSEIKTCIGKCITEDELGNIASDIQVISKCKSLIAWLREAITKKNHLKNTVNHMSMPEYCKLVGRVYPEYNPSGESLSSEAYWDSQDIFTRNRYYSLETICSVYGDLIHKGGAFSNARQMANDKLITPIDISEDGSNTIIRTYTLDVPMEKIDEVFFELQKTYRAVQAELNKMKADCVTAQEKYADERRKLNKDLMTEYNQAWNKMSAEYDEYKDMKNREISNLKIVIPNELKEIYKTINEL